MAMNFITPESKPDHIGIIDATSGQSLADVLPEFDRLRLTPEFSSVVICRNSQTLQDTFDKLLSNEDVDNSQINFLYKSDDVKQTGHFKKYVHERSVPYSMAEFEKEYGTDFLEFEKFLQLVSPHSMAIRTPNAHYLHTDSYPRRKILKENPLAFGFTATMAGIGYGTEIADCGAEFFRRDERKGWRATTTKPDSLTKIWTVQTGDIAAMRSRRAPADLIPCLHRSSKFEQTDIPCARVVGVAAVEPG